jgi:hypothetical protein
MGLPIASAMIRKDWEPPELKHLSRGRKRNQIEMSWVKAIENDIVQTESRKGHVVLKARCSEPTI